MSVYTKVILDDNKKQNKNEKTLRTKSILLCCLQSYKVTRHFDLGDSHRQRVNVGEARPPSLLLQSYKVTRHFDLGDSHRQRVNVGEARPPSLLLQSYKVTRHFDLGDSHRQRVNVGEARPPSLLLQSYKVTRHFDLGDWCRLFEVSFVGEEGLDWGGLRREWFELLCTELFDPARSGLFMRFSTSPQGMVSLACVLRCSGERERQGSYGP